MTISRKDTATHRDQSNRDYRDKDTAVPEDAVVPEDVVVPEDAVVPEDVVVPEDAAG